MNKIKKLLSNILEKKKYKKYKPKNTKVKSYPLYLFQKNLIDNSQDNSGIDIGAVD